MASSASTMKLRVREAMDKLQSMFYGLRPRERIFLGVGVGCVVVFMSLFAIFHESVINWMVAFSVRYRSVHFGWLIILLLIFTVSFPPLMGYSALSMFTGMVYGFPGGWPLLAAGTLFGSFLCFVTFRFFFQERAKAITRSNVKLMAFAKTLEDDKFTLLWLIRLCPLPYSLSNAAISSVHTVSPTKFFIATACTTPKLLLHIFIGDRLARLGKAQDSSTKIVNIFSIVFALVIGVVASYVIYQRTTQIATEIEARHGHSFPNLDEEYGNGRELDDFEISGGEEDEDDARHDSLEPAPTHTV